MRQTLLGLVTGLLFGAGLAVSQMADPGKVLAFLDIWALPSGGWDPSLAFVMAGALAVTFLGYRIAKTRKTPWLGGAFQMPGKKDLDRRLLTGAALFGLGWGLVGYCPGPAVASLAYGRIETLVFVAAMLAGMALYNRIVEERP